MTIQFTTGDLFVNRHHAEALAHGCNCQGLMGAGIAVSFRERYPRMYEAYRRRCKAKPREFNVGDVFFWKEEELPAVFNLGTQEDYRHGRATCQTIEMALLAMKRRAAEEGVTSIALPRIGAGYGGLSWTKVRTIIESVFKTWPGTLYVYEQYAAGE